MLLPKPPFGASGRKIFPEKVSLKPEKTIAYGVIRD
jgi:hypothetical protein